MRKVWLLTVMLMLFGAGVPALAMADQAKGAAEALDPLVADILDQLEARYAHSGFAAHFDQTYTDKAMGIADTAAGELYVRYPGKMRWEYTTPHPALYVTDGKTFWRYLPEERQVTVGLAAEVLGGRQGASFLSDIRLVRKDFKVTLDPDGSETAYRLKLEPQERAFDIQTIYLKVARATALINEVITINVYGDSSRITFAHYDFNRPLPDRLFDFQIPEGTDVLEF